MIRSYSVGRSGVTRSQTRPGRRSTDVRVVQRATTSIVDLNESLDRAMRAEPRPDERLRMLRATTNQITRAANDAIQAYRRARAAVHAELQMPGGDRKQAQRMQLLLDGGRADILRVLEVTSRRYSWADPWPSHDGSREAVRPEAGEHHGHSQRAEPARPPALGP